MNLRSRIQPLKILIGELSVTAFNELVRGHNDLVQNVSNPGELVASDLTLRPFRGSGYNLPVGGVYADANGFLKVVREGEAHAPSFVIKTKLGTVTAA